MALLAGAARADVLHVPGEFPTVADALAAAQPGDQVVLAAGSYPDPILVVDQVGITLRGQGKVVLTGGTALAPALTVENCTDVIVDHLRIEGALGTGVFVQHSSSVTLRKLRVTAPGDDGILAGEASGIVMDRCHVEDAGGNGISILLADGFTVSRCTLVDAEGAGVSVSESTDCVVERCHVSGVSGEGIVLGKPEAVSGCVASKNIVELDGSAFGIDSLGADNVLLENRILGCSGLRLEQGSTGGHVAGNTIIDCNRGILCFPANVLLQDNKAVKPFDEGFTVEGDGSVLIGNRALHAGSSGFHLINSIDQGSVLGCKALHSAGEGFEVDAHGVIFTDNTAKGSGAHGFFVEGTGNVFVGNSAHDSAAGSLQDETGDNTYLDNDFDL